MISKKQIAALKYLIFKVENVSNLTKQILAFLLNQSCGLTKEVYLTITANDNYTASEIRSTAIKMDLLFSSSSTTHLNEIMVTTGTDFLFSLHYGNFDRNGKFNTSGQFGTTLVPLRYTFWCSRGHFSKTAKATSVSRTKLESINLEKPGLYPNLEKL
ncbi:MAG: hypothetical protein WC577_03760 [Candidatus Paceibacterota bacterium]